MNGLFHSGYELLVLLRRREDAARLFDDLLRWEVLDRLASSRGLHLQNGLFHAGYELLVLLRRWKDAARLLDGMLRWEKRWVLLPTWENFTELRSIRLNRQLWLF